ncbi:hypothetical protein Tco_0078437 [Tanacetum coccineum]
MPPEDEDDDEDVEEDRDEEEEEHLALANSVPPPVYCVTARMSIRDEPPTPFWSEAEVARLLSIPSPPSSPLSLWPKVCLPPRKRLCIAFGPGYKVGESLSTPAARPTGGFRADYGFVATLDREIRRDPERDVGYGITDTWDEMLEGMSGAPATDETELGRDRHSHAYTALLIEREARLSREAWGRSMDASDTARFEVRTLRTTVLAQKTKIAALRVADRARQVQHVKTLRLMSTLQTHVTAMQGQQGPTSGPAQPEISKEAGSSS